MTVALVTCAHLPEPDPDETLLLAALRARGVPAELRAWDDPDVDWTEPRAAVLRSTWNYPQHPDQFVAWIDAVDRATTLINPAEVVRGNLHKRYLLELAARGVPAAETELVPRGVREPLAAICARRGWYDVVVKPAISAASFMTARFSGPAIAGGDHHLRAIVATRDALVQPYVRSVETSGERSLVWIAGEFTHTVRKRPRFSGGHEAVDDVRAPTPEERALGEQALQLAGGPLTYARVDVARDAAGRLVVMELELMEPSLFLAQWPAALDRFADAIAERYQSVGA